MNTGNHLTYIDLFAGCGGLSLGLHYSGWKGIFAIEKDKHAFKTLKHNLINNKNHFDWLSWLPVETHEINEVIRNYKANLKRLMGKVTLVVGGPPCQGFSTAGKRDLNDARNKLVDSYIELIRIVRPKLLLFENVRGFVTKFRKHKNKKEAFSEYIWRKLEEIGYNIHGEMLDFSEFGIPQRRKRFILIGSLNGDSKIFFDKLPENKEKFLNSKGLKPNNTLGDAISDLLRKNGTVDSPDSKNFKAGLYSESKGSYQDYLKRGIDYNGKVADSHRFANHLPGTIEMFLNIQENVPKNTRIAGELRKKYNVKKRCVVLLDDKQVCPTLTSHPDDYLHYSEPRILTVREYARIQSFPDWYEFKGKYTTGADLRIKEVPRYTQLGNAVPPLFAEQAGIVLKELL